MRIDVFLTENGLAASRTEAKTFILAGAVTVGGRVIDKPSFDFNGDVSEITIDRASKKYAGRGGFKLEGAIKEFNIEIKDRQAIDVGASTGGFTDCLLQNGAAHVIAVDSGSGQLADFLRRDSRVTVFENYNARYMKPEDFEYSPSLAVMDVSFISSTYIIPAVYNVLSDAADFICLIKPQFEVGRSALGKGGIVKNEKIRAAAVEKVTDFAKTCGFSLIAIVESPIRGGDGNVEYLAHFRKGIQG